MYLRKREREKTLKVTFRIIFFDFFLITTQETNQYIANICKKFGSYNLAKNGTVFDPTMIDIDVYLAQAIPEFDEFDEDSNTDTDLDQHENIEPTETIGNHIEEKKEKPMERVGKIKISSESVLQVAEKRIRLNSGYVEKPQVNRQNYIGQAVGQTVKHANSEVLINCIENQDVTKIEVKPSSLIQSDGVDSMKSRSLDGISSNIAADLMKMSEETVKNLINERLEHVLHDEKAIYKRQLDAMKLELDDVKSQLQKAISEKVEFQQIADRKNLQLEKRDRQLAQANLNYNDLMVELYNAKYLCDACGKKARSSR